MFQSESSMKMYELEQRRKHIFLLKNWVHIYYIYCGFVIPSSSNFSMSCFDNPRISSKTSFVWAPKSGPIYFECVRMRNPALFKLIHNLTSPFSRSRSSVKSRRHSRNLSWQCNHISFTALTMNQIAAISCMHYLQIPSSTLLLCSDGNVLNHTSSINMLVFYNIFSIINLSCWHRRLFHHFKNFVCCMFWCPCS